VSAVVASSAMDGMPTAARAPRAEVARVIH
jgi:hypothetical protein